MRPKIGVHDYEVKKGHVVRFLQQGAKVKVTIMFRGRETANPKSGEALLNRLAEDVVEIAKVETPPKLDGWNMTMVLNPLKEAVQVKPRPAPTPHSERRRSQPQQPQQPEQQAPEETQEDEKPAASKRPIKITRAEGG